MADSSSAAESKKTIILRSSEGDEFKVEKKVAMMMQMIQHAIEDHVNTNNPIIPLPNIGTKTLALVVDYCNKHATNETTKTSTNDNDKGCSFPPVVLPTAISSSKMSESNNDNDEELKGWDKKFIDDHGDLDMLFEIINAAYLLNIRGLTDLTCAKVADMMRGKNIEEMRRMFNLVDDFTPQEEEEIHRENSWFF